MGLFNNSGNLKQQNSMRGNLRIFEEAVKDTDELYNDLIGEYYDLETVTEEFTDFTQTLSAKLDAEDFQALLEFTTRLKKLNALARNSVRDVRYILHSQKKMLNDLVRESK